MDERIRGLTEKERATLRLMVRGHDAKSIARSLGLSVHTVNERLRDARRKLQVSSSREAARLLLEWEGAAAPQDPQSRGDKEIGEDSCGAPADQGPAPIEGAGRDRRSWFLVGGSIMIMAVAFLAFAALSPGASPTLPTPVAAREANAEVVGLARQWLELLDQGRWADSYAGTGTAFQTRNSLAVWAGASEQARTPLGAMISRSLLSQETLPAPPAGYEVVKFRTRFANRTDPLVETVTFEREGDSWRVVGVMIG